MGEYADDLIEAGLMGENPFGRSVVHQCTPKPKAIDIDIDIDLNSKAFSKWYASFNWSGCSKYEISSMAWHEVCQRVNCKEFTDDEFSWWFDDCDICEIMSDFGIAQISWNEAVYRYGKS